MSSTPAGSLSASGLTLDRQWRKLAMQRRFYTALVLILLFGALFASLNYANSANAGGFFERLPYFFDFTSWLIPKDWNDVWRALFDIAPPIDNGTEATNYQLGRVYLFGDVYLPEYFELMLITLNIAILSTIIGAVGGGLLCFLAARNTLPNPWIRGVARRTAELFRAFPEIVIAGLFAAVLSIGPIAAIIAVGIHTIGALGKMFYEVVENTDMKASEGLTAAGASWIERMRFGVVPLVLPNFVSYTLLRLEINVRASTIIGAVGGGGIGQELKLAISRGFGAKTLALVLLLFITIVIVDNLSAYLRRKLVGEQAFANFA